MPYIDNVRVENVDYDVQDSNSVHTINGVAPTSGELSLVNGISIVNGQLCVTYQKEVDE